jgi:hypothetical protein
MPPNNQDTMKTIQHSVFVSSVVYSVLSILSRNGATRRLEDREREKIRQQAEEFINGINGIGAENVVSVTEHAPLLGPFSVVVWWQREAANADALVVRAADDKHSAYHGLNKLPQ